MYHQFLSNRTKKVYLSDKHSDITLFKISLQFVLELQSDKIRSVSSFFSVTDYTSLQNSQSHKPVHCRPTDTAKSPFLSVENQITKLPQHMEHSAISHVMPVNDVLTMRKVCRISVIPKILPAMLYSFLKVWCW